MIMPSPSNGTRSEKPPAQKVARPDDHLALARLMKRKHDLLRELGEIREEEANIRRRIKERGEVEPDSLLFLSDDSIRAVMKFLSIAELSKFEACARLRRLITPQWDKLLADAEKRIRASRPVFRDLTNPNCSKYCLMFLHRSVDLAVDTEKRTRAGEVFETNRDKHYAAWRDFNHIFVRISHRAGSSDGGSFHVAWQGFVSAKWAERGFRGQWGIKLTLPEEASLYELHPHAKALKEDFNALKRKDISFSEWRQREKTASAEISDKAVISVIATRLDQGPENFGTIVSEMVTSSRIDGRIGILPTNRPPCLVIFMASTREETKRYDISLHCDENSISLSSAFLE